MLKIPFEMIPKMIQVVHFNDEKPENKNIFLPNKKDNFVKIFKDNKWIYQDKNEVLKALVTHKYNVMDNHYDIVGQEQMIGDNIKTNYLEFNISIHPVFSKTHKKCMIIFNGVIIKKNILIPNSILDNILNDFGNIFLKFD